MAESIPEFDLYASLGVPRDAPPAVVLAAYRALIRRDHPDLSSDPASADRSKRLNVARDWLLDPVRRARYDAAHLLPPSTDRPAARRTARRTLDEDWWGTSGRARLEVFVVRCADLTPDEMSRLSAQARVAKTSIEASVRTPTDLARRLGREPRVTASTQAALASLPIGRAAIDGDLGNVLAWTALGFAITDVAPREAAILLGPWRAAIDASDARARARRVRRARTLREIRVLLSAATILLAVGIMLVGVLAVVAAAVGWIAFVPAVGPPV